DADIRTGNRTVKVVAKDGTTTIGRLLNQDTYSLQMIDAKGNLIAVMKDAVRSWDVMTASAMPNFTGKLAPQEIADVVSYLETMKVPPPAGAGGGGRGGGRGGPGGPAGPGGPGGPPAGPGGGAGC